MKNTKNRLKSFLTFIVLLLASQYGWAQVVGTPYMPYIKKIPFSFLYGGSLNENVTASIAVPSSPVIIYNPGNVSGSKTADGGYIAATSSLSSASGDVTGTSHGGADYWAAKFDAAGKLQWQKLYGGSSDDYVASVQQTDDGGYMIAGSSRSSASGDVTGTSYGNYDYWVVKLDASGNIQWQKRYGGAGYEAAFSAQQTIDGGYIVAGWTTSSASGDVTGASYGGSDYWVVKLDASGNIQWQKRYGGSSNDLGKCIKQTGDGGYIIMGHSLSSANNDITGTSHGNSDYWVAKLSASGTILWQQLYGGGSAETAESIQETADGGYILGGYSSSSATGDVTGTSYGGNDYWVVKLNASGAIQWQKIYGGSGNDRLRYIMQTADSGYILSGYTNSSASGNITETNHGNDDAWTVKLDASGNIQWQRLYGGTASEEIDSIHQNADGSYTVFGSASSSPSGDITDTTNGTKDLWIMKIDASGNIISVPDVGQ